MTYQPLHHKYRPQTFGDLVGQTAIATTLTNALQQQRIAPAYLFTGARGTGKTSSARILAKSLNCLAYAVPTAQPCGVCEVCQSIARGSALDVIEIDAASNTGVDNMRELIERSQFAPVQCRYKVYVIDECLTGDSLITTDHGLMRIDDPTIEGKKVLSYNESSKQWEFKQAIRWLDQGSRHTFSIETSQYKIECTGNHLLRTATGWIAAKDVKEGVKLLSPVNVDAAPSFINSAQTDGNAALFEGTSLRETPTGKEPTTFRPSLKKLNRFVHSACVGVANDLKFLTSCEERATASTVFCLTGKNILSNQSTAFGRQEPKHSSPNSVSYHPTFWDLFTEPYWVTAPLPIQMNTVASQDYPGRMANFSKSGWHTKQTVYQSYDRNLELLQTKVTETNQFVATQPAILNSLKFLHSLSQKEPKNESLWTGSVAQLLKGLPGGTWMMAHLTSALKGVREFNFIPKGTLLKKINLSLAGSPQWAMPRKYNLTEALVETKCTTLFRSGQMLLESFWQTYSHTPSQQWHTNLEVVKSVRLAGVERVYDIEVEDNHNFVANGLLVHNCHMLSTAAFNALLKTLEEPPDRVVFVLATTDPQRVLPTIISRCQRFDFRRIPLEANVSHLRLIATKEAIAITDDALTLIAQISQGGMRDAESLLDQLSLLTGEVTVEQVWDLVGSVPERDLMTLLEAIAQDKPEILLDSVRRLMDRGREPLIVLQNLASFYRDLLIAKTAPARNDLVALTPPTWDALCHFAQALNVQTILAGQQQLRSSEDQLKSTTQPRLWLEVTLMGLLPSATSSQRSADSSPAAALPSIERRVDEVIAPVSPPLPAVLPQPQTAAHHSEVIEERSDAAATPAATPLPGTVPTSAPLMTAAEVLETSPASRVNGDLSETWQQILSHIDLPGTRGMLNVNCHLLSQSEQEILIGVKTQGMLKMINGMLPQLEKACAKAFRAKVKVALQVVEATSPATQATDTQTLHRSEVADRPANSDAYTPPSGSASLASTHSDRTTSRQDTTGQPSGSLRDRTSTNAGAIALPGQAATQNTEAATNAAPLPDPLVDRWPQEDEVTLAARQLADFFSGRVINMSDSDTVAEAPKLAEIDLGSLQAAAASEPEDADSVDSEDDVPF